MTPCQTSSWESRAVVPSAVCPGVEFIVAKMTFGRRIELMRQVRDLATRAEFFAAGRDAANDMEATLLGAEIDRLYLLWGLEEIRGLDLDGSPATPAALIESGPEDLFREALEAVKAESALTEEQRKN